MANINLNQFRNTIKDLARPNRFVVQIRNPLLARSARSLDELIFYITKAQIPSINLSGPTINYRGTQGTLIGDYKKEPLTLSFLNDEDWKVRTFFEDWLHLLVNYSDIENDREEVEEYHTRSSLVLSQLGLDINKTLATYTFSDVVPMEISNIELDQGTESTIQEFTVTFEYTYMERT